MTLPASYRTPKSCQNRRGVALVLVLGALLILSVVLVAFLSSVTIAAKSSRAGDQNIQTRWLSETCVNLVISQIEKATTQTATCWASQPGMIRNFDTTGQPAGYYKLYSSSTMSDTVAFNPTATANQVPSTWVTDTGLYTDLNSPITDGGITYYPILDPKAIDANAPEGSISAKAVDQFKVDQNALAVNAAPQIAAGVSKVPMPVQWLYVLQDGTTVAPTGSGSAAIVAGATPANPIVSRIAFWTDDESCKVNINTASEGTYFDVPHADTSPEREFAKCQPVIGEYQRYPGHPAMTSLSAVFGSILTSPTSVTSGNYPLLAKYYQLTPRVTSGGTQGGTVQTQDQLNITALTPKLERLYTSPDELLYTPARTANSAGLVATDIQRLSFFLTANSRAPEINLFGRPRITIWPIHNNPTHVIPDPYQTQQDRLIAFCSQLKGDGTKPDNLYYFQRQDPHSTTYDYANIPRNQALYKYLQDATSRNIPGFGDNFVNKYTAPERDQILTEIFDYIRSSNLNDPKLPIANTYTWYYNPDPSIPYNDPHGQYANYPPYYTTAQDSPGQVVPIAITAPDTGTLTKGAGRFPIIDEATLIFYATKPPKLNAGKFETYIRCALVTNLFHPMQGFMCNLDRFKLEGTLGTAAASTFLLTPHAPLSNGGPLNFFSDAATPGTAILWANSNAKYGTYFSRNWGGNHSIGPLVLGKTLYDGLGSDGNTDYRGNTTQNREEISYTFVSKEIALQDSDAGGANSPPLASPQWDFTGGTFKIRVLSANSGTEIQTYTFNFPSVTNLPMPKGVALPFPGISNNASVLWYLDLNPKTPRPDAASQVSGPQGNHSGDDMRRFIGDITNPQDNYQSHQNADVLPGDVARSLQLAIDSGTSGGDQRLIAYTKDVPPEWFTPHIDYLDSTKQFAHNLREGNGFSITGGGGGGTFIKSLGTTDLTKRPWIRSELGSTADVLAPSGAPADWDTSFGAEPDGAYLDKADEGASTHESEVPYFFASDTRFGSAANLTEANRQMPSAGIFGSLPTGVKRKQPWQTLLFRPDFSGKHPGATVTPQDHLWLDLFQMPIVTPYAISEPFSTGGKINLNYQIVPFTYITRDTGIRAVLKNERLIAIADGDVDKYKTSNSNPQAGSIRLTLSLDETLKSFESRFAIGDIFRSASEICNIPLVPTGTTLANISTFWTTHRLTGDNLKERPYTTIYPRITTKSNVFTVHYRVQLLTKPAARLTSAPTSFDTSLGDTIADDHRTLSGSIGSTSARLYHRPDCLGRYLLQVPRAGFPPI